MKNIVRKISGIKDINKEKFNTTKAADLFTTKKQEAFIQLEDESKHCLTDNIKTIKTIKSSDILTNSKSGNEATLDFTKLETRLKNDEKNISDNSTNIQLNTKLIQKNTQNITKNTQDIQDLKNSSSMSINYLNETSQFQDITLTKNNNIITLYLFSIPKTKNYFIGSGVINYFTRFDVGGSQSGGLPFNITSNDITKTNNSTLFTSFSTLKNVNGEGDISIGLNVFATLNSDNIDYKVGVQLLTKSNVNFDINNFTFDGLVFV